MTPAGFSDYEGEVPAMAGKAVPSTAGGGPRDFSEEVHGHFAQPPSHAAAVLEARIHLGGSEAGKIDAADVFSAIAELLARHGVDMDHCFHEASRAGDEMTMGSGRMPR